IYYEYNNIKLTANMTTPDPLELQSLLRAMVDGGVQYVVMEVSAHAIFYKKLFGVKCDIAIFTNLSQDHLDFFKNMDSYKECKKSFFCPENIQLAIVNNDDDCGQEIAKECKTPVITYGLRNPCDAFAIDIDYSVEGCSYVANVLDEIFETHTKLLGEFNIYNTLASCIVARNFGVSISNIVSTLNDIEPPLGRFNAIKNKNVTYVVDFAHTPDGLYNLLKEAKKICLGKIITIFGCGGDRDVTKRPIMGKIASEMSDIVIVTSDNPRTESRKAIVNDILGGIRLKGKLYVELDRAKAILLGEEIATAGDMVIVAGKGSENFIDENHIKIPFNDMLQVLSCLESE
ncbi:MAG: UDP-N-acetylmuramoyl-L-alanyl-D-glutamate--2,6-diaminopimelate ligase, partial [Clostridia bacterium]